MSKYKLAPQMNAAALKYNSGEDNAPVVVAAGSGFVAEKILAIADECGINVYKDDSAATVLSKLELGREIPPELYKMVIDIYMSVVSAAESIKDNY